jgi:predicted HTH domain antitoxin
MTNATNVNLTIELEAELAALVEAGNYESEREAIRDALEALIDANPNLRLEMAITLWKRKQITLGRAVKIARSDHETIKQELAKRGLYIEIDMSAEEIKREARQIAKPRRAT